MSEGELLIANETKAKLPSFAFALVKKIKRKILGKNYRLNIIFVGNARSRVLNSVYRKINKPTNILSFPIEKQNGEIYLTPQKIKSEIKIFNRDFDNLVIFLLIHGMFHLKGERHGSRMESKEKIVRTLFDV